MVNFIKEAVTNLAAEKLRTFLAVLGILVGTASVVTLMLSSQLAALHAMRQFRNSGAHVLAMDITNLKIPRHDDKELVQSLKNFSQINVFAPYINLFQPIYIHEKKISAEILGVTDAFARVAKIKMSQGRFVSILDHQRFYCVIGSDLAKIFQQTGVSNPIGKPLIIGNWIFTVVGVADSWQSNWFLYANINNSVIIPLEAAYFLNSAVEINHVLLQINPKTNILAIEKPLLNQLQSAWPGKKIFFRSAQQIMDIMKKQQATFTGLLSAIGSVGLLVGGIGALNTMLVAVLERRREIGIRMAIGARRTDIRRLFLTEAVILALLGGLLGVMTGIILALLFALTLRWELHFFILPPALGLLLSVCVGVIAGFYPAHRASLLNPIETLRGD